MVRGTDSESLMLCVSQISCGLCAMYPTTRHSQKRVGRSGSVPSMHPRK